MYHKRGNIYHYQLMNLPVVGYYKGFTTNYPIIVPQRFTVWLAGKFQIAPMVIKTAEMKNISPHFSSIILRSQKVCMFQLYKGTYLLKQLIKNMKNILFYWSCSPGIEFFTDTMFSTLVFAKTSDMIVSLADFWILWMLISRNFIANVMKIYY